MTREEIKDELYRMLSDVLNGNGPIRNNAQRGRYREVVKSAIEAVEQKPNKWIPVSERMPEDSDYFLAFVIDEECPSYHRIDIAWFAHPKDYDTDKGEWREIQDEEKVLAWMPLPEPYKAESEDKA